MILNIFYESLGGTSPEYRAKSLSQIYVLHIYYIAYNFLVGRDSSVGIATGYGLDGPGIEFRWG